MGQGTVLCPVLQETAVGLGRIPDFQRKKFQNRGATAGVSVKRLGQRTEAENHGKWVAKSDI